MKKKKHTLLQVLCDHTQGGGDPINHELQKIMKKKNHSVPPRNTKTIPAGVSRERLVMLLLFLAQAPPGQKKIYKLLRSLLDTKDQEEVFGYLKMLN